MAEKNTASGTPKAVEDAVKAVCETEYTIDELVNAAHAIFGTDKIVAKAALKMAGREKCTEAEAKTIVKRFTAKEVK